MSGYLERVRVQTNRDPGINIRRMYPPGISVLWIILLFSFNIPRVHGAHEEIKRPSGHLRRSAKEQNNRIIQLYNKLGVLNHPARTGSAWRPRIAGLLPTLFKLRHNAQMQGCRGYDRCPSRCLNERSLERQTLCVRSYKQMRLLWGFRSPRSTYDDDMVKRWNPVCTTNG